MDELFSTSQRDEDTVGVIVARFVVPKLHSGHRHLINHVRVRHAKTVIVLGVPRTLLTDRYSLSHDDRAKMILEEYPDVVIVFQRDCRSPEQWSRKLDETLSRAFKEPCVLYGSRDSFVPKYINGCYKTSVVDPVEAPSGTDIRQRLTVESFPIEQREAFRAGQIRAVLDRPPTIYLTADVILFDESEEHVWLGQREGESGWRFSGGFAEVTDSSAMDTMKRELKEEFGVEAVDWKIIGTHMVDDWRYRNTRDRIMTVLHTARLAPGNRPVPGDDPEDAIIKVHPVPKYDVRHWLTHEHRALWDMYLQSLSSN